jgi:membrane protease YdiL (CAAX protease family)
MPFAGCAGFRDTPATANRRPCRNAATDSGVLAIGTSLALTDVSRSSIVQCVCRFNRAGHAVLHEEAHIVLTRFAENSAARGEKLPLLSFFALTYAISWAYWIPLAVAGVQTGPGSRATHLPGLLGPGVAAFIMTGLTEGRTGVSKLAKRLVLVSRPVRSFLLYSLSPLLFLALARALASAADAPWPAWRDFAIYSGLPPLGLPAVFALVLLFNGFGEETGWRGYALEALQRRYGPVAGTLILALLWAGWHTPTFFIVETYRTMSVPMIVGGFGLGICAGTLVLSRIAQRTNGSVLAAAMWHALYNMTSATAASRGLVAAVTTTCVMVWATVLLVRSARSAGLKTRPTSD